MFLYYSMLAKVSSSYLIAAYEFIHYSVAITLIHELCTLAVGVILPEYFYQESVTCFFLTSRICTLAVRFMEHLFQQQT